jgi:hypothetical protein
MSFLLAIQPSRNDPPRQEENPYSDPVGFTKKRKARKDPLSRPLKRQRLENQSTRQSQNDQSVRDKRDQKVQERASAALASFSSSSSSSSSSCSSSSSSSSSSASSSTRSATSSGVNDVARLLSNMALQHYVKADAYEGQLRQARNCTELQFAISQIPKEEIARMTTLDISSANFLDKKMLAVLAERFCQLTSIDLSAELAPEALMSALPLMKKGVSVVLRSLEGRRIGVFTQLSSHLQPFSKEYYEFLYACMLSQSLTSKEIVSLTTLASKKEAPQPLKNMLKQYLLSENVDAESLFYLFASKGMLGPVELLLTRQNLNLNWYPTREFYTALDYCELAIKELRKNPQQNEAVLKRLNAVMAEMVRLGAKTFNQLRPSQVEEEHISNH